jgi:hypothetical protein
VQLNPAPCEKIPIWITLAMGFRAASMFLAGQGRARWSLEHTAKRAEDLSHHPRG